jgi:hypothetical protein
VFIPIGIFRLMKGHEEKHFFRHHFTYRQALTYRNTYLRSRVTPSTKLGLFLFNPLYRKLLNSLFV